MFPILIKATFIHGLQDIVSKELKAYTIIDQTDDEFFLELPPDIAPLKKLKSITKVFMIRRDAKLNPIYISKHKSIIGEMITTVMQQDKFASFKILCAGSDSPEVQGIRRYIEDTFKLTESEDADLKIHIHKPNDMWEVGVQLTPRPLSLRAYKVENVQGGLNPTIAYAMNSLANLEHKTSYLNICSGSGTLLIEAASINPKLKLQGFDIDGVHNARAIANIKKAGFIKQIKLKTADLFTNPDFGMFDVIAADLPFGMLVSKDHDLESLYTTFVQYCEKHIQPNGTLLVYTTEGELLEDILHSSTFSIIQKLNLRFLSSVNAYMTPTIFVCKVN